MTGQGGRLLMTLPALACPVLIISGSSRRPRWPLSAWRVLQPANVQCYQALFSATQLVMAVQWWPGLMNADWCSCALELCPNAPTLITDSLSLSLVSSSQATIVNRILYGWCKRHDSKCEYFHTQAHVFAFAIPSFVTLAG